MLAKNKPFRLTFRHHKRARRTRHFHCPILLNRLHVSQTLSCTLHTKQISTICNCAPKSGSPVSTLASKWHSIFKQQMLKWAMTSTARHVLWDLEPLQN